MSLTLIMDSNLKLYHQKPTSEILKDAFPFPLVCPWRMSPSELGSEGKTSLFPKIAKVLALQDVCGEAGRVR